VVRSIRSRPLAAFFVLVFAITWAVWVPRAAGVPVGVVGQLWTWVPAAAALITAALAGGRGALGDLGARLVRWRVGWRWYAVIILGPAIFSLVVAALYALLGGDFATAAPAALSGETSVALLPLLLVALFVTDGLGEEPAWRGFALPRLLVRHEALVASLVLGALWAAWHLPLVWTEGAPLHGQLVWLLFLDTMAKSVLFTWVFLHTRGSALIAALLHATTNLFAASPVVSETGGVALLLLAAGAKWVLVAAVVAVAGPGLAKRPRPGALPNAY